jgi:hypothetical protein
MSGGFPVTLVDADGAPFTPASRLAPLATVSDAGVPVTLVSSGAAPLIVDGWTPADLGVALLGQIDAEDFASLTITTGLVDAWADTVAAVSFTSTLTARPAYSATSFNGRPGVTFDGTNDALSFAGVPYPAAANPCEIWVACSQDAVATSRTVFGYGNVPNTSRLIGCRLPLGNPPWTPNLNTGTGAAAPNTDGPPTFSGIHILRAEFGATQSRLSMDGVAGTPTAAVPATVTTKSTIGGRPQAAVVAFFQGVINCILITSPLTNVQAASLRAYLARRGGI